MITIGDIELVNFAVITAGMRLKEAEKP